MILEIFLFLIGFLLIIKGADFLIEASSSFAKKKGVPQFVIGLTIVAFGTSLPELIIMITSAIKGTTDVGLGNIIGANIIDILLLLGLVAIIKPFKFGHSKVWKEIPFSLFAASVLLILGNDALIEQSKFSAFTRIDGIIMLFFFFVFAIYMYRLARKKVLQLRIGEIEQVPTQGVNIFFVFLLGFLSLYLGGKWVVDGAVSLATELGLSTFMISATIVAVGTTLPELTVSLRGAMQKKYALVVGDVIGSIVFNIFAIVGVGSLIKPILVNPSVIVDMLFLVFVTLLLFFFMFIGKKHHMDRWQGFLFVGLYLLYLSFLLIRG